MPKISILMTSYNHECFIKESLESVLNQTFCDFELIIVDDCSSDTSFDIIKSFKDPRIKAIRNDRNIGPEYAFEMFHKTAKGKYVAIADSDNIWEKDKLEKQYEFLENNHNYAAVFTKAVIIDQNGELYKNEDTSYINVFNVENRDNKAWLNYFFYNGNCLCHPSILIRREKYKDCNMSVNALWQIPDLYKWIKLCLNDEIYIIEETLVRFRVHNNNVSDENLEAFLRTNNELYSIYKLFYNIKEEDFLYVFPKASKYLIDGKINIRFALSKLLLHLNIPAAHFAGLQCLFEILNNKKESEEVYKLYDYDAVAYKNDETKYSPFILGRKQKILTAKLYLDFGSGFNESNQISVKFLINFGNKFNVKFQHIKSFAENKKILALRFDPCEFSSKINIQEILGDGLAIDYRINEVNYNNSEYIHEKLYDVFYSNDPSYIIDNVEDFDELIISGTIDELYAVEVFKAKEEEIYKLEEEIYKLNKSIANKNNEISKIENINKDQKNQLDYVYNSLSWKITKPLRFIKNKLKKN